MNASTIPSSELSPQDLKDLFAKIAINSKELDKRFAATEKLFATTDKRFAATDKRMNKLQALFESQWGKLMESLVEGDLTNLLQQRDIMVNHNLTRMTGPDYEFDIIAVNGNEIVVVEVKTTLKVDDVQYFLQKLSMVKQWMREYSDKTVYGAVAWLKNDGSASTFAQKNGLFSIRATGSSAAIINTKTFTPTGF